MKHISHERRLSFEKGGMTGQQVGSSAIKAPTPKKRKPKATEQLTSVTTRT